MVLVSIIWSLTPVLDKLCLKNSSINIHGVIQSSGMIIAGGSTGSVVSNVEQWNGTSWATAPSLGTARNQHGNGQHGNNSTEQVFVAGGVPPPTGISTTEEWSPETTTANIADFTTS